MKLVQIAKTLITFSVSLKLFRTRGWTRLAADAEELAAQVSRECGLAFEGRSCSTGPNPLIILVPFGRSSAQTFSVQITQQRRSLRVSFEQGAYCDELIKKMGHADEAGRNAFAAILTASEAAGAAIELTINGQRIDLISGPPWEQTWNTFGLVLRKGQLPLGIGGKWPDISLVASWSSRVGACLVALLPQEDVEINRCGRDRRHRAAALRYPWIQL